MIFLPPLQLKLNSTWKLVIRVVLVLLINFSYVFRSWAVREFLRHALKGSTATGVNRDLHGGSLCSEALSHGLDKKGTDGFRWTTISDVPMNFFKKREICTYYFLFALSKTWFYLRELFHNIYCVFDVLLSIFALTSATSRLQRSPLSRLPPKKFLKKQLGCNYHTEHLIGCSTVLIKLSGKLVPIKNDDITLTLTELSHLAIGITLPITKTFSFFCLSHVCNLSPWLPLML